MLIRLYRPSDTEQLSQLFQIAAQEIGGRAYTPQQLEAWKSHAANLEEFGQGLAEDYCLVVEENNQIAAFAQLCASGHISYLYTLPPFARRGYATALLKTLEYEARQKKITHLFTEASLIGRFCFRKNGFLLLGLEEVERDGTILQRYRMQKILDQKGYYELCRAAAEAAQSAPPASETSETQEAQEVQETTSP